MIARALRIAAVLAVLTVPAYAETDQDRRAKPVAHVGSTVITVGQVEDRLAAIPPLQLMTFGSSREAIVKKYLEEPMIRDLLLAEGARQKGLDKEQPWEHQLKRALSSATLREARKANPSAAAIPMEDVKKFYDENRTRFDSPERVNLWRILCKTRDEADTVLAAAKKEPTIQKYTDLAREHSIDKATNLRGGNLGFLDADGKSNEAGVAVDPALVTAAHTVKDGEFVASPVPEAGAFAVVWRRATVPANKRTVEDSAAQIRATLYRERTEKAEKDLIAELRKKNLKEVNVDLLKIVELGATDASLAIPRSTPKSPLRDGSL